jgi:signal transduction histidine kinase
MSEPSTLRLMMVEDSPTDVMLFEEALAEVPEFEHELIRCDLLGDALRRIRSERIDVVLLDLGLPDSAGLDTFRSMHAQAPDVPVVVLTAYDDMPICLQALRAGAQDYLIKRHLLPASLLRVFRYSIERQRLVVELSHSRDQFRKLASHLQHVREHERTRISRDVHDGLGQKLSALKMDLRWLETQLAAPRDIDRGLLSKRLMEGASLVDAAIESVQTIATDLRPGTLDQLGLEDAIREESRRFAERTAIRMDLEVRDLLDPLDKDVCTALFRIFQELLTNVVRHAQAKTVRVFLATVGSNVELHVGDDGIGMPAQVMGFGNSLGLLGMRERAAEFRGDVSFESQAGRGTRATVTIPIRFN